MLKLCRDDAEALVLLREASSHQGEKNLCNNITDVQAITGTSKAYSLTRLKRIRPDLFTRVVSKELSANQAMQVAGFRKKQITPDQISLVRGRRYNRKATNRGGWVTMDGQNVRPSENPAKILASQYGVDERTIRRDGKFAESVEQRKARIFDMHMACYSQEEIAEAVNCDQDTVSETIKELRKMADLPKSVKLSTNFQDEDFTTPKVNICG